MKKFSSLNIQDGIDILRYTYELNIMKRTGCTFEVAHKKVLETRKRILNKSM